MHALRRLAAERAGHDDLGRDQGNGQEMIGAGDVGKLYSGYLGNERRHQGSNRLRHAEEYVSSLPQVHQTRLRATMKESHTACAGGVRYPGRQGRVCARAMPVRG